ncbi:MAG: fumarylacetoacetase [Sphingomonadaceae bacterium]|nr:fumarylacetoacetase [Sphingomonadaceae bacterium]
MIAPIDATHDPARPCWVVGAVGHRDFPIQNLPLGIFSAGDERRGGIAIGDFVLDLRALAASRLLDGPAQAAAEAASGPTLNPLLGLGSVPRLALRRRVSELLSEREQRGRVAPLLHAAADCVLHLPAAIGDYTDFYAGIHHASNVGRLFRPDNPLLPNYKYVPIGYHGRASSVRSSDTGVVRPVGQRKPPEAAVPLFGPTQRLDYELEMGAWIGPGNDLGSPIAIGEAEGHVAGLCLLNDWSARDIQAWEYQPLGPFLAKSFATTVSPWIVTAEALAPFRIAQPPRPASEPAPLPHLFDAEDQARGAYAIRLEAALLTANMRASGLPSHPLSSGQMSAMYWTIAQLVAHHASNGCNLRPGDLLGTGTISAPTPDGYGSLLEITNGGATPLALPNGETRSFLQDGDEVILTAHAEAEGFATIGFGPCRGTILPARA